MLDFFENYAIPIFFSLSQSLFIFFFLLLSQKKQQKEAEDKSETVESVDLSESPCTRYAISNIACICMIYNFLIFLVVLKYFER